MIVEDTQTSETQNSEAETQTSAEGQTNQSSSTTADDEKVDLGTGKTDAGENDTDAGTTDTEEDTRTDEEKAADEERAKLFGAPEADKPYEITGLPEGMEVDKVAVEKLTPLARKLNLSNEGFSALAQTYATEVLPNVTKQITDALNGDVIAKRKEWEGEARELIAGKAEAKTLSGEKINFGGRSMGEVQKVAAKALDKLAPAGFREWLDETGLGVSPQMIAFAYNVGKDIAEDREMEPTDTGASRKSSGGRPMSDASKFYNH